MFLSWRFGFGVVIAFVIGAILMGCSTVNSPRPANAPPRECGRGSAEWTLAQLYPAATKILARWPWDAWLLGETVTYERGGIATQFMTRLDPWTGERALGTSLFVEGTEYELRLLSADANGCFLVGLDSGLALFRYRGRAEVIYIRAGHGWVGVNPRGGSTLR